MKNYTVDNLPQQHANFENNLKHTYFEDIHTGPRCKYILRSGKNKGKICNKEGISVGGKAIPSCSEHAAMFLMCRDAILHDAATFHFRQRRF
jgi:hypothetical protein